MRYRYHRSNSRKDWVHFAFDSRRTPGCPTVAVAAAAVAAALSSASNRQPTLPIRTM